MSLSTINIVSAANTDNIKWSMSRYTRYTEKKPCTYVAEKQDDSSIYIRNDSKFSIYCDIAGRVFNTRTNVEQPYKNSVGKDQSGKYKNTYKDYKIVIPGSQSGTPTRRALYTYIYENFDSECKSYGYGRNICKCKAELNIWPMNSGEDYSGAWSPDSYGSYQCANKN